MRTPEEICKEYSVINNNDEIEKYDLLILIKDIQKEAYNEALDKAAENAEAAHTYPYTHNEPYIIKSSILKLKI